MPSAAAGTGAPGAEGDCFLGVDSIVADWPIFGVPSTKSAVKNDPLRAGLTFTVAIGSPWLPRIVSRVSGSI